MATFRVKNIEIIHDIVDSRAREIVFGILAVAKERIKAEAKAEFDKAIAQALGSVIVDTAVFEQPNEGGVDIKVEVILNDLRRAK